jgi:hypothetical protein
MPGVFLLLLLLLTHLMSLQKDHLLHPPPVLETDTAEDIIATTPLNLSTLEPVAEPAAQPALPAV